MNDESLRRLAWQIFRRVRAAYEDEISYKVGRQRATDIIYRALQKVSRATGEPQGGAGEGTDG